jgi:hypothetical protein
MEGVLVLEEGGMEGRHWVGAQVFRPKISKKNIWGSSPLVLTHPVIVFQELYVFFLQGDKKYAATGQDTFFRSVLYRLLLRSLN